MRGISHDIIDRLIKFASKNGFSNPNYAFEPGSQKGDNFMGIITKLNLEDVGSNKVLSVVVKTAASDPNTRAVMHIHAMFGREVWMYRNLIPIFKSIRKQSENDILQFPECIEASDEDGNEWLAFEDMCSKGYSLHRPRLSSLDETHMKIALTALAEFHALSFVLKHQDLLLFNKLTKQVPDTVFPPKSEGEMFKSYLGNVVERALNVISNKEHKEKLEKFCDNLYEKIIEVLQPNQYRVFCHGDYWKNNIMFKYKNGKPISVCALDYQIVRAASPVVDILYLIFCCTTKEERSEHFDRYLQHYHNELSNQLTAHQVEFKFPWSEFLLEAKRCCPFVIGMAMMVLPLMTCSSDNVPEVKDLVCGGKTLDDSESYELFSERMRGVIEDCISYGFI